jgi:hypothetical protein
MPIEIRELVIQVKVDEREDATAHAVDLEKLKRELLRECRREIKKEMEKRRQR